MRAPSRIVRSRARRPFARAALQRPALAVVLAAAVATLSGCPRPSTPKPEPVPTKTEAARTVMLQNAADKVVTPAVTRLAAAAATLDGAVAAWQSADAATADAKLADAQTAWRGAQRAWQHMALFAFGPAGLPGVVMAGEGYGDAINSWPEVSPCGIDTRLATDPPAAAADLADSLVNLRGLDALEYLLYAPAADNSCAAQSAINRRGTWAALSTDELLTRRKAYAAAAAKALSMDAAALKSAWLDGDSAFARALQTPGSAVYKDEAEALDAVYAAVYALELDVKDKKMAIPLGIHMDCTAARCPERLESPFAEASLYNVIANLEAFQAALLGHWPNTPDSAPGELDTDRGWAWLLRDVGADAAATDLVTQTQAVLDQARGLVNGPSFKARLAAGGQAAADLDALHETMRGVTRLLKTDVVSALHVAVPAEGAGDND